MGSVPETPGTGLGALAWAFKHVLHTGRPIGGSGALTDAIAASLKSFGGSIVTGAPVATILCEGASVVGVETADGRSFRAPTVVVASDPREAIVRYLSNPPSSAKDFVDKWRNRTPQEGYESKIDARISAVPTWRYHDDRYSNAGLADPSSASTLVAPPLSEIHRGFELMQRGQILERPMLFVNVPSINDPTLAPAGEHVLSIEVLFTPYSFTGGWEERVNLSAGST
ncbi:MAG: FAD-dependent oxidoreductase [Acidimicrobiales bacterium]